jgi:hypothetical protein
MSVRLPVCDPEAFNWLSFFENESKQVREFTRNRNTHYSVCDARITPRIGCVRKTVECTTVGGIDKFNSADQDWVNEIRSTRCVGKCYFFVCLLAMY